MAKDKRVSCCRPPGMVMDIWAAAGCWCSKCSTAKLLRSTRAVARSCFTESGTLEAKSVDCLELRPCFRELRPGLLEEVSLLVVFPDPM
eukprot:CAMPEP_0172450946 /NCGR_PEP_ID=MMETSP1065-20121228/9129_1 /TAXON_ID=265537 /ORGANISM="Amphiprora paludosa, Strain CCMP125" /LENGTH=88 /DNA_ID=CAMNT_0013202803 /DNA_START=112 /DNA_END=375 /DNA_ORIENTATION=-